MSGRNSETPWSGGRFVSGGVAPALVRAAPLVLAVLIACASCTLARASGDEALPADAEIRGLQVENAPHDLFVSFSLSGAFTREIREQIESGLPVTFSHYVEIGNRRA